MSEVINVIENLVNVSANVITDLKEEQPDLAGVVRDDLSEFTKLFLQVNESMNIADFKKLLVYLVKSGRLDRKYLDSFSEEWDSFCLWCRDADHKDQREELDEEAEEKVTWDIDVEKDGTVSRIVKKTRIEEVE